MKMEEKDFEPAGLIPRSIIRTVERFQQQLRPETVALGIQEFRISRYQVRVSVRYFFILLLLPLTLNWAAKNLIIKPIVGYFWNSYQTSLFLNSYQAERAFQEMRDFESQLFFEMLLSTPENSEDTSLVDHDTNILGSENCLQNQNLQFKNLFSGSANLLQCPPSMREPSLIQDLKLFPLETGLWFEQVPISSETTLNNPLITISSEKSFLNPSENQKVSREQDLGLRSHFLWVQPLKTYLLETLFRGEFLRERGAWELPADPTEKLVLEEQGPKKPFVAEALLPEGCPLKYGPSMQTLKIPKFQRESFFWASPLERVQNTNFSSSGQSLEALDMVPSAQGCRRPNETTELHPRTPLNLKTISQRNHSTPRPKNTMGVIGLGGEPLGDWRLIPSSPQSLAHQIEPLESHSLEIQPQGPRAVQTKNQTLEEKSSLDSHPGTYPEYQSISQWRFPEKAAPDGRYPDEVTVWRYPSAHGLESQVFLGYREPKNNVPVRPSVEWTIRPTDRKVDRLTPSSPLLPLLAPTDPFLPLGDTAYPSGTRCAPRSSAWGLGLVTAGGPNLEQGTTDSFGVKQDLRLAKLVGLQSKAQKQQKALTTRSVSSSLSDKTFLINLIGQEPQKTNLCLTVLFQKKTALLAEIYNQQSITALSNMFGDCVMILTIIFLVRWNAPQFTILKSFLIESFYSFNDAIKCFYIILITDFLVGFHSPRGWEIAMEMLLRHLGLPENEEFILLFVGTFPVFLDTAFKYWIFRYLNKISPSTVATYHSMIE